MTKRRLPPHQLHEALMKRLRKRKAKARPKPRPKPAPAPTPVPSMPDTLTGPLMFVVSPGGNDGLGPVEHVRGMKQAGYRRVLLNAFDGATEPEDMAVWRRQCEYAGMPWDWWARCYEPFHLRRLSELTIATRRSVVVFNCEDELAAGRVTVEDILEQQQYLRAAAAWHVDVAVSTVAPLYESVRWERLSDAGVVVMPQAFANVLGFDRMSAAGALAQAQSRGARLVNVTVGIYEVGGVRTTVKHYEPLPPHWSAYHVGGIQRWEAA